MFFFPAIGDRNGGNGEIENAMQGKYWSSTLNEYGFLDLDGLTPVVRYMAFDSRSSIVCNSFRNFGLPIRCVADSERDCEESAVKSVSADKIVLGYYSILGKKLEKEPNNGVYIIMYDNGKTEKVVK